MGPCEMTLTHRLAHAALAARLALAVPNYGVSKTSLSIDRHREALDNGEILVRVQRWVLRWCLISQRGPLAPKERGLTTQDDYATNTACFPRTDDLFTDPTAHEAAKLLVEKHTHIALRIQLDPETGSINVNDQPLDLQPAFQEPKVTAIKAEVRAVLTSRSPVSLSRRLGSIRCAISRISPTVSVLRMPGMRADSTRDSVFSFQSACDQI